MATGEAWPDIRSLKENRQAELTLRAPILDGGGRQIAHLACVDRAMAARDDIVADLTVWRRENAGSFLTQFTPSHARTRAWLENLVIPAPDRLLFLIVDDDGRTIGNCGLCNIAATTAELDNILRGRPSRHPRIAFHALTALIGWAASQLGIDNLCLHVFSDNARALKLYDDLGFAFDRDLPLTLQETADGRRYLVDSPDGEPVDVRYRRLILPKPELRPKPTPV